MAKPWDSKSKRILIENPQHTVDWLLPGATYINNISAELENETIYADLLFDVRMYDTRMLLHIEIQRRRDSQMSERMWKYNARACIKYDCPVASVVIYLIDDGAVAKTPFTIALPNGRVIHQFEFDVVKLWEIPTEYFSQRGLIGLLPFLPLTKNGARREVIEDVMAQLTLADDASKSELLLLTYGLASLILISEADQEWLIRRFGAMHDMLEETPAFQELMKYSREKAIREGMKQGIEKGRQEGVEIGRQEAQQEKLLETRETVLDMILELHPQLRIPAQELIDSISDTRVLRHIIVKIPTLKTSEDILQYLRSMKG